MMHPAINALFLHYPFSGTGRYLAKLIDQTAATTDLSVLGAVAFPPSTPPPAGRCRLLPTPFDRRHRQLAKVWFEQITFPFAVKRSGATVAHYPYFAAPLRPTIPTVATVHDLVPILRPEYRRTAAQRLYTTLVERGLRSVRLVITDSQASARDIERCLAVPPERIRVIPLGVDRRFRPLQGVTDNEWASQVLARLGLTEPYILYLGGLDRRKNVAALVRAFARLKRDRDIPELLAIAGTLRPGDSFFYDPRPDLERLGMSRSVRLLGPVADDDLRALHARAEAFAFPSRYEGFGLPPLEAMACGTPVVCSMASSLPEVVGDAALLFDPGIEESLVEALWRVLTEPDLRRELSRRGIERAAAFTWEKTTRATMAVWQEVSSPEQ